MGAAFLGAATVASALGFARLGAALGGIVAALALLGATTGICVGCLLYRGIAALRGRPCEDGCLVKRSSER